MSSLTAKRSALAGLVTTLVVAGIAVSGASAAVLGVSLNACGTAGNGYQFTINGSGFGGYPRLDIQVMSSEAGAAANPNYVVSPSAPADPYIGTVAPLNADGSFSFAYGLAEGQQLPATIGVYTIDELGNNQTLVYSTVVSAATVCTDGTNLVRAKSLLPTSPDQCKGDGYRLFAIFKSGGDCVSFVSTIGRNQAALLP